jgi:hypothetical protein
MDNGKVKIIGFSNFHFSSLSPFSFTRYILGISLAACISCSTPVPAALELGVDTSTVRLGVEESGNFVQRPDKTFSASERIVLLVKAKGLTVKQGKIRVNIDLFLKKDKDILGTENDILGKDGLTQQVPGVDPNYSGSTGETDLEISIIPPSDTKGELSANVTLKDLNTSGKLVSFETKFVIK